MQADPQSHVAPAGPGFRLHRPLDRERGRQCRGRGFEHREHIVPAGGHLVAAGRPHRGAHAAANVREQGGVLIVQAAEQLGRALDVGQQERDVTLRQLALWLQLRADEPDRHDAVLLGRPQQPVARPVPRCLVLERDLAEARERVPDVRRIVDRQAAATLRVDVGEGAIGELRALFRAERCHGGMISRASAADVPGGHPRACRELERLVADAERRMRSSCFERRPAIGREGGHVGARWGDPALQRLPQVLEGRRSWP